MNAMNVTTTVCAVCGMVCLALGQPVVAAVCFVLGFLALVQD